MYLCVRVYALCAYVYVFVFLFFFFLKKDCTQMRLTISYSFHMQFIIFGYNPF